MENIIEKTPCRLLLVEGQDEIRFFTALAEELGISDALQIVCFQDKNGNLRQTLIRLALDPKRNELVSLGIVRDAEYNTNALDSVCGAIRTINGKYPTSKLPIPDEEITPAGDDLKVSVMILPGAGFEGMLEDLILNAYQRDSAMACVDRYFECLEEQNINVIKERVPKNRMRVFLASKMVSPSKSKKDHWMGDIYRRDWWSWEHTEFNPAKSFLQDLATI